MMTREQREKANRLVETLLDVARDGREAMLEAAVAGMGEDGGIIRAEVTRLLIDDDSLVSRLALLATSAEASSPKNDDGSPGRGELQERVPSIIGRYHLRGLLGGGGMGVVYLAEQRAPIVRTVAIKLIRAGCDTHEVLARFEAERQALARMDHAHIARVFDAGITEAGRPYFAMEYVPGEPITQFADKARLSIKARLELFAQVCDAISHAHMKGVIHRDLKPSNLLAFFRDDDKPIAKVIDFGIAKAMTPGDRLGGVTSYTQPNLVLGTYEYMSPEQAAGLGDIDTRSDVYSLGVLLYELIGGVRPFEREDLATRTDEELRRVIRDVEPPRPSTRLMTLLKPRTNAVSKTSILRREEREASAQQIADARRSEPRALARMLQRELEWIPLMAMRKERTRRYRGATELAADVRNWLAGKPLVAAPESTIYRARKFVVAHRRAIAAITAAVLLLVAGVIGTSVGFFRESRARELADANGTLATRAAYRSAIAAADVALRSGDGVSLRWALDSAPAALRGWEWNWLRRSGVSTTTEMRHAPSERFARTICLPDNRRAWTETSTYDAWQLWDLTTGEPIRRESGRDLAMTPDGRLLAIVRPDGTLDAIDVDSGASRWHFAAPKTNEARWRISLNPFSRSGRSFVAWDGSSALTVVDVASGTAHQLSCGSVPDVVYGFLDFGGTDDSAETSFVFRPGGSLTARSLNLRTGVITQAPHFDYFPSGKPLNNTTVDQLESLSPSPVTYNIGQRDQRLFMALLPHSGLIATGDENGSVVLHGVQQVVRLDETASRAAPEPRRLIVGQTPATWIAATPDERLIIATTNDGEVHVCPIDQPTAISAGMGGVRAAALSPDGTTIAAVAWGNVQCFDVITGLPAWGRNLGPFDNRYVAWSPDGATLVVASGPLPLDDGSSPGSLPQSDFFVLDGKTGAQRAGFSTSAVTPDAAHPARPPAWARGVRGMAFSSDGKHLLVSRLGTTPAIVDTATWEAPDATPPPPPYPVGLALDARPASPGSLVRSPGGTRLAEVQGGTLDFMPKIDGGITLRDASTLKPLRTLALAGAAATAVVWSPDDRQVIASFSRPDATFVIAFNAADGVERYRVATPDAEPVTAITCTPDGSRVLAFTQSRRMLVIDARTGEELLVSTSDQLVSAAFLTIDGALVVSDDTNAFLRYESQDPEQHLSQVHAHWPAGIDKPSSVAAARRAAWKVNAAIYASHRRGELLSDANAAAAVEPAVGRALLMQSADRFPPNINWLNSDALSISMVDHPKREALERAAAMLRLAVAIKPQSGTLQNNLGTTLFRLKDFEAARAPLRESLRIGAEHHRPADLDATLRLAIAAQKTGDADAASLLDMAMKLAGSDDQERDPETQDLLGQLSKLRSTDKN